MILRNIRSGFSKVQNYLRHGDDAPVQNGLACTPANLLEMTSRGIPIAPANLGLLYQEGVGKLDYTPPLEYQRGVDIGVLWEAKQASRKKLREALSKIDLQKGVE